MLCAACYQRLYLTQLSDIAWSCVHSACAQFILHLMISYQVRDGLIR